MYSRTLMHTIDLCSLELLGVFSTSQQFFKNVRRTCHINWNSISLSRYKVGIHTEHRFDFQIGLLISRLHSSGYHVMCFTRAKIEFVLVFCYTFQNINKNRQLNFSKLNFGEIFNSGFWYKLKLASKSETEMSRESLVTWIVTTSVYKCINFKKNSKFSFLKNKKKIH